MAVLGADFHLVEGIAHVGVAHFIQAHSIRIVGLDGHQGDAFVFVIRGELLDARLIELRGRAMIACKYDDQHFACGIVGQAMRFAIDSRKTKIRRRRTNCQRRWPAVFALLRGR
jgi:hypothetical protein